MTSCNGGLGAGILYTYAQLEGLWINAGGSKALAPTMAAIAMAESGGCSTAYNASGATGLWQILGAVNPADQANLTDPSVNAKEAVLKYTSQGLTAWTTYSSGAYKAYMNGATTPDTNVPGSSSSSPGTSTATVNCVISIPVIGCIMDQTEARALIGGLMMGVALLIGLVGVAAMAAVGFEKSGVPRNAQRILEVSGAGAVASSLRRPPRETEDERIARVARTAKQSRPYGPTRGQPARSAP